MISSVLEQLDTCHNVLSSAEVHAARDACSRLSARLDDELLSALKREAVLTEQRRAASRPSSISPVTQAVQADQKQQRSSSVPVVQPTMHDDAVTAPTVPGAVGEAATVKHDLPLLCGWCYTAPETPKRCARCKKRIYCSKACQMSDWKLGAHQHWCGVAGELGTDVAVRRVDGKGCGLFAMRNFARGEKLLVERAAITDPRSLDGVPSGVVSAASALMPHNSSSLVAKFQLNCFEMEGGNNGLFIMMAYANHACLPNALHHSLAAQHGVKILVASVDIAAGEEICHSYVSLEAERSLVGRGETMSGFLASKWGFTCRCRACIDPSVRATLTRMRELDASMIACAGDGRLDEGLRLGSALIAAYDQVGYSPKYYARTYYVMFQLAIARQQTLKEALTYIQRARSSRVLLVGKGTSCEEVRKFEQYVAAPKSHPSYLVADG